MRTNQRTPGTELLLADGEARFRELVQHSPYCIHEIDMAGALTSMNPAGLRMMGVDSESAIIGMPYLDAVGDTDRPRVASLLARALSGEPSEFEFEAVNGLYFRSTFVPIRSGADSVVRLMGLTLDVTERTVAQLRLAELNKSLEDTVAQRTRELVEANQELTPSNRDLAQFAYVASHDLRAPLRTMSGFAAVLANELELDGEQRRHFQFIVESAGRMESLVEALLVYSRAGGDLKLSSVNLNEVLGEVLSDLALQVRESGATLDVQKLPSVRADAEQIRRVFLNLVSNALKFRGDRPLRVRVGARQIEGSCCVEVEDNGIGIEPGEVERVFDMFRRVHSQTKYEGTGIGLALVRRIVDAHGGSVEIESTPGAGTTFRLYLPSDG